MFKPQFYVSTLILAGAMAIALAGPVKVPQKVPQKTTTEAPTVAILSSGQENNVDGSYHFFFNGEDGTHREESGVVHNKGEKNEYLEVTGTYSYQDMDGKDVLVHYTADKHGFVPEGNNILPEIVSNAKLVSQLPEYLPERLPVPAPVPVPDTNYQKPPKF